ncbi:MAG: hypothetical protein QOE61_3226 [Micromonosporaceae bacterium]|nr:hypothetical protein [Micromonosporaceae bacterium]
MADAARPGGASTSGVRGNAAVEAVVTVRAGRAAVSV